MPPQKKDKKKHNRGKQYSTFEEVSRREGTWKEHRKNAQLDEDGGSSSSDEEDAGDDEKKTAEVATKDDAVKADSDKPVRLPDTEKEKKAKKKNADSSDDDVFDCQPLNRGMNNDDMMLAGGPTRKQREEIERERKRKAYEKLHKEGKTDEAKRDLERLAEIRKEREAAKAEKERIAAEEAAKKKAKMGGSEYMAALGGERSRKMPGGKKDRTKDECGDMYEAYRTEKKVEEVDRDKVAAGSIEACRLEEEDFM